MVKKAYQIRKEGDFYVIPAGYLHGVFHKEIKTMDRTKAVDAIKARKTLSLKRKYPEIRQGILKQGSTTRKVQINWETQMVKEIPDYISGGKHPMKLQGLPSTEQVAKANENYYKHHGHETVILKTRDGRHALYVSEK